MQITVADTTSPSAPSPMTRNEPHDDNHHRGDRLTVAFAFAQLPFSIPSPTVVDLTNTAAFEQRSPLVGAEELSRAVARIDVEALPDATPVAGPGYRGPQPLPPDHVVDLDRSALYANPPDAHMDRSWLPPGPGATLMPRPLPWMENGWSAMFFAFVSKRAQRNANGDVTTVATVRCMLHHLDGTPCNAEFELAEWRTRWLTAEPLSTHLSDYHAIDAPRRVQRRWQYGLCECGEDDVCCVGGLDLAMAPCCFVGRLYWLTETVDDMVVTYRQDALGVNHASKCNAVFGLWASCLLLPGAAALCWPDHAIRQRVVRLHNIAETPLVTCLTSFFCCPCSAIQVHREVASAGVWPGYTCFSRRDSRQRLATPQDVLRTFRPITRDDVVCSRQLYVVEGHVMT